MYERPRYPVGLAEIDRDVGDETLRISQDKALAAAGKKCVNFDRLRHFSQYLQVY